MICEMHELPEWLPLTEPDVHVYENMESHEVRCISVYMHFGVRDNHDVPISDSQF